jgi:hypothetical protein
LAVVQAAHAAELLIKARIAQEHPLLVFDTLPRPDQATGALLNFEDLFKKGKTVTWSDLPARLWAAAGMRLADEKRFKEFGELRNMIQHFTVPGGRDLGRETVNFVFGVLDPFINDCWDLCAIDYDEDDSGEPYIVRSLVRQEIVFRVPQGWGDDVDEETAESLANASPAYRDEMGRRFKASAHSAC